MEQRWLMGPGLGVVLGVLLWRLDGRLVHPAGTPARASSLAISGVKLATLTLLAGVPLTSIALAARAMDYWHAAYAIALSAALLWIATIDARWGVIPNRLAYPLALAGAVLGALLHGVGATL